MWVLHKKPLRYSEIKAALPGCSVKVLSQLLKEMERNGFIIRTVYPTKPIKVVYSLHDDLQPMMVLKEQHNNFLVYYFLKRAHEFSIPSEVINKLKANLVTK